MSKSRLFSGKIKKLNGGQLSVDRYEYLDTSQAEPDLGLPSIDGSVLVGSTSSNVRLWSPLLSIGTQTVIVLSTVSNRFSDQPQALDIKGGAIVRGNLHVSGTAYLNDAEILTTQSGLTSVLGNSIINQILLVNTSTNAVSTNTGALQVIGGVGIGGNLYVGGTAYLNNAEILTTSTVDLYATKTTIIAGTDTAINTSTGIVTIWNTSTLQSITDRGNRTSNAISIENITQSTSTTTGALTVAGGAAFVKDVRIGQNLYVQGIAYLNDAEVLTTSSGLSSILGRTEISQDLFVSTTTNSTSTTTGAIVTPGGIGIGQDVRIGKNLYVAGTAFLNNAEVLTTASRITSSEGLTQVTQEFLINTTTNTISVDTGALQVRGGAGFVKDVRIGQNLYVTGSVFLGDAQVLTTATGLSSILGRTVVTQDFLVNTLTNSVSTETGAIVTYGGVGIGQDVFVGGKINIKSTLNSTSTLANNALYVEGGVGIQGGLYVDGPALFRNSVVFSGTSTNIFSTSTLYTDNFIDLHFPSGPDNLGGVWSVDDGKDIGHIYHHYKAETGDEHGALIWHNESDELRWYMGGVEYVGGSQEWNFTTATLGVFRTGSILLQSTTSATSTTTGTLVVAGGVGIGQDIYVGGNVNFSGDLYKNGVLVGGVGFTGSQGNFGGVSLEFSYVIDFNQVNSNPGVSSIKFNSLATQSATNLNISNTDVATANIGAIITSIDDSTSANKGYIRITKKFDSTYYAIYQINGSVIDNTTWYNVPVLFVAGSAFDFPAGPVLISFERTGDTGSVGFTGSQGSTGTVGFTGSAGLTGFTGSQGSTGTVGFTGSQGSTGTVGFTGSTGTQGAVGFTGSKGEPGIAGTGGSDGTPGFTGSAGFTGSQGSTGTVGFTGSRGSTGTVGFTGSVGFVGSVGFTGSLGFTGSKGEKGDSGTGGASTVLERHYKKPGVLTVAPGTEKWYVPLDSIITSILARVEIAPQGATPLTVGIKINAVTTATLSINSSTTVSSLNTSTINLRSNDAITVDVLNIGNTIAGSDLTVTFTYIRNI